MARGIDTDKNASFATPAKAPVDVKYRSERATMSLLEVMKFVNAIDPSTLPEGVHAEAMARIAHLGEALGWIEESRPRTKTEAKAAAVVKPPVPAASQPAAVEVAPAEPTPEEVMRRLGEAVRDSAE